MNDQNEDDARLTVELINDLDRWEGARCHRCQGVCCGHQVLYSVFLGLKDAPVCLCCAAETLERPSAELRKDLDEHLQRRPCYQTAWREATRREGVECNGPLVCVAGAFRESSQGFVEELLPDSAPLVTTSIPRDAPTWDAGWMACGDLVLALRGRLAALEGDDILQVIARDPAAPEDLPAWCRLTGNLLLEMTPPLFRIQRKRG